MIRCARIVHLADRSVAASSAPRRCRSRRPEASPTSSARCRRRWRASGGTATVVLPVIAASTAGTLRRSVSADRRRLHHRRRTSTKRRSADGARALLVDCPELFDREGCTASADADYPDNPRRFALLVRAALEYRRAAGATAVSRPRARLAGRARAGVSADAVRGASRARRTRQRLHHSQSRVPGLFEPDWLPRLDLPWDLLRDRRGWSSGDASAFSKAASTTADADHDRQPAVRRRKFRRRSSASASTGSCGARSADLVGVLNGIDTEQWDPARDPHLPQPFSADDLAGKRASKAEVLARYGLPDDDAALERPLIGMISRMVDQKGFDLIAALADELLALDATFVVLGTGEPRYQDLWRGTGAPAIRIGSASRIGFDEALAHLIEGGRRHLPDAVAVRAVRAEPDVQPAVRHGPSSARVGGLADTGRATTPRDRPTRQGSSSTNTRRRRCWRASAGAGACSDRAGAGARFSWPGCARTIPGTVRPGSTSKYMNGRRTAAAGVRLQAASYGGFARRRDGG